MERPSMHNSLYMFFLVVLAFIFLGVSAGPSHSPSDAKEIVALKDFTKNEVRGMGITLSRDLTVHVSAVGGGGRSFWRDAFDQEDEDQMYAAGWIIDADTRKVVWDMTMENTHGQSDRRTCEEDVNLKKGSYEVYFMAYGYASGSGISRWSMNIDRRKNHHSSDRVFGGLLELFTGDSRERYDDFMEYAKERWGITLSVPSDNAGDVQTFEAPRRESRDIVRAIGAGDDFVFHKDLVVDRDTKVHIYAIGEGQRGDDVDDFGWLVNADTRERVWDMNLRDIDHAGGARKNIQFDGDVNLPKGTYELYYITDGSHSNDDWNARPPYDPFNYGVTVSVVKASDRDAIKVVDPTAEDKNVIVRLTELRDNDYKSLGFSLKEQARVRVYALGESYNDGKEMADYGWILNADTREKVWTMKPADSYHAGGAEKNRLFDEVITLPKGNYLVCYQTDGSHSYGDWNAEPPFDPSHWGITVMGAGTFDAKVVSSFSEDEENNVLAQLIKVGDDEDVHQRFSLEVPTKVRIYALGEADGDEMADYGWIKNKETGQRVWEMDYDATSWAGGAKKNRLFDKTITLDKGEYEVYYRTDGSHSYNDWNDDPPDDRTHWGITVYTAPKQ